MTNRINMRNYAEFMKELDEEADEFIAEMEEKARKKMGQIKDTIQESMTQKIRKENFQRKK